MWNFRIKTSFSKMRGNIWWLRDRKNWAISNTKVLVWRFLTHFEQIRWVRKMPVSVVEHCLSSPSWLGWIKLLDIKWNWSLSPITLSISLPKIFKRMIEQNDLGELSQIRYSLVVILGLNSVSGVQYKKIMMSSINKDNWCC